MKKRISIDQLRPGMFIVKTDLSWLKTPFLRKKLLIQAESDVAALREAGVKVVVIDILRGDDTVQSDPQPPAPDLSAQTQAVSEAVPEVAPQAVPEAAPSEDSPASPQTGQAPSQEESPSASGEAVSTQETQFIFDADRALAQMAGDEDLLNETIAVFLAEYPKTLERMHTAAEAGDAQAIEREASSLKNAAGNLGASDAYAAALSVEQLGQNQNLACLPSALITLTKELERFEKILFHVRPASRHFQRPAVETEQSAPHKTSAVSAAEVLTEQSPPHENSAMSACEVLIADAGQTSRTTLCALLRQHGIQNIREVEDGVAALNALHESRPNLIISDWNLSGIRSIDLLRIIRRDDKLKAIPMMMVTDTATRTEVIEAYQAGVNGYLLRPFSPQLLAEQLKKVLVSSEAPSAAA